jgi:hypothetical protein
VTGGADALPVTVPWQLIGTRGRLEYGVGDRLLQAVADAVGDFAHVLVLA